MNVAVIRLNSLPGVSMLNTIPNMFSNVAVLISVIFQIHLSPPARRQTKRTSG